MDQALSQGMSGAAVGAAQACWSPHTAAPCVAELKQDGIFGRVTRGRTIEFHRRAGLTADGVIGPSGTSGGAGFPEDLGARQRSIAAMRPHGS